MNNDDKRIPDKFNYKVQCVNNVLYFQNSDSYFETIDFIMNSSENELDIWESSLNYISNRRHVNMFYDLIDSIDDYGEYSKILSSNCDIVGIQDNSILPVISDIVFSTLANRDGIFYVNDVMHKVLNDRVYMSDQVDLSHCDFSSDFKNENIYSYNYILRNNILKSTNCGLEQSAYKEVDKRRVLLDSYLYYVQDPGYYGTDPNLPSWQKNLLVLSVKLRGEAKNIFGNWKSYSTQLKFDSGSFKVNVPYPENNNEINFPQLSSIWSVNGWSETSSYDTKNFWKYKYINKYPNLVYPMTIYFNNSNFDIYNCSFEKAYVRGTSRGIGFSNYAIIDCGQ